MSVPDWLTGADRTSPWSQLHAVVAGLGGSGFAAADALAFLGARVTVVDDGAGQTQRERADVLDVLGVTVLLGHDGSVPQDAGLLVVSPGLRPDHRVVVEAAGRGVPVWSGEQLAWQLRPRGQQWLVVSGTNGKTTTTQMLTSILRADGRNATAAGNIGRPLVEAVTAEPGYDVLAVELSSFQLHFTRSIQAHSSALLNVADDHVDWHGSTDAYVADKARVYAGTERAIVFNEADPVTERLAHEAEVVEGCRGIGFTLGVPDVGSLGLVDEVLVDRAFIADRQTHALELATVADVPLPGSHNVANALAAAALARSYGVTPGAVKQGLRTFAAPHHRLEEVAVVDGVRYVDDSKATNAHAAAVALAAFDSVVWIAGGLAKGGTFDDLVRSHAARLRGAVLLGADRHLVADALARHAPEVPRVEVLDGETDPMQRAVRAAAGMARPGETVLLAPACASLDQFADYAARGDAFAAAVRALAAGEAR